MPRKNDYQAFASSFLDLWQEQIARAMSDTDFLQTLMDNMQQMQAGMFGHEPAQQPDDEYPADASEPGADELADLRRRLAAAERKITKLEANIDRLKEKPKPAAKPKPKPATKPKPKAATKRAKPAAKPTKSAAAKSATTKKPRAARKRAVKRR